MKNYVLAFGVPIQLYGSSTRYCSGLSISNVRFYARKLTQTDVDILYNNGAGL